MKLIFKVIVIVLICLANASAQVIDFSNDNQFKYQLDISASKSVFLSYPLWGFCADFKFYPIKKYALGLTAGYSEVKVFEQFDKVIGRPQVGMFILGFTNQLQLYKSRWAIVNFELSTGLLSCRLADASIQIAQKSGNSTTYSAKEIVVDTYFALTPGLDLHIPITDVDDRVVVYLTLKAKQAYLFGKPHFSSIDDLSKYALNASITVIGF